jgi:YkoP-like protein
VYTDLSRVAKADRSLLRPLMLALDRRLRDWNAVVEYTNDPLCILRMRIGRLDRSVSLEDGTVGRVGDRMIDLHLWNEHIPLIPRHGASVAWARQWQHCMDISFRELVRFLVRRPDLNEILVMRAITAFGAGERSAGNMLLMQRYGFEPVAGEKPATMPQRGHRLAENVLMTLMVLAHNPVALRTDTLRRGRTPLFMSRRVLEARYGPPEGRHPGFRHTEIKQEA